MILRELGLRAQELETGPFVFLLSHGIPVAYRDRRPDAMPPGWYRSDIRLSKATTRHQNKWLEGHQHATIPHELVLKAFQGISRFTEIAVPSIPR